MNKIKILHRWVMRRLKNTFLRFKLEHFHFQLQDFTEISYRYNRSKIICALHYISCSYIYGCDLSEYFIYEFYKLRHIERKLFITRFNKFKIYKQFREKKEILTVFGEKPIFNKYFNQLLKRSWLDSSNSSIDEIVNFLSELDYVMIKPPAGLGGKGIRKIRTKDIIDLHSFAERCKNERLLLEEVLEQADELSLLNPDSVNTIRIIAVLDRTQSVNIISAALRVGRKGSVVDNISSGGVIYPLDAKKGVVLDGGVDATGRFHMYHPETEILMLGYKVPRWPEVISTVEKAMMVIPEARMVAWDICVTNEEVSVVEGNLMPNPRTMQIDRKGKKMEMNKLI